MKNINNPKELVLVLPCKSSWLDVLFYRHLYRKIQPLALHILAALTPKDYKVSIYNQSVSFPSRLFRKGMLVGISCATYNAHEAYKIGDRFRKAGAVVVMGGIHASYFPEEALKHADSVVVGEAESVWPALIKDYEAGLLQSIYRGIPLDDWAGPTKEYFLSLRPSRHFELMYMLGRGCKYRCSFCVPFFGKPRLMKMEQALEFIRRGLESMQGARQKRRVHFLDDNIFSDPSYAKELFRALIPLGISWTASSSIDIGFDEEALTLAKESGCVLLCVGIETIMPERFPKTSVGGMHSSDDLIHAIQKIQLYDIKVMGAFVLGFDDCTHEYCFKLLKFMAASGLFRAYPHILTPYPGTRIFDQLKSENRIFSFDWRQYYSYRVVFKPKHMSVLSLYLWHRLMLIIGAVTGPLRRYMVFNVMAVLLTCLLFLSALWAVFILLINTCLFLFFLIFHYFR